jgi:hypothetical protein
MHVLIVDIQKLECFGVIEHDDYGRVLKGAEYPADFSFAHCDTGSDHGGHRMLAYEEHHIDDAILEQYNFNEDTLATVEHLLHEMDYEIHKSVLELDEAMYVAMISFAFPF